MAGPLPSPKISPTSWLDDILWMDGYGVDVYCYCGWCRIGGMVRNVIVVVVVVIVPADSMAAAFACNGTATCIRVTSRF